MGNLSSVTTPNQVTHSYTYNRLNRLTSMSLTKGAATLASYAYTLGAAGNRLSVSEQNGRVVTYSYDNLYRLTQEQIASDPVTANNGVIGYSYDAVGNRLSRTSSVAAVPSTTSAVDANDRLTSDAYDNNGNTVSSNGNGYLYDFENHLLKLNAGTPQEVSYLYDGDGNRVRKTVGTGASAVTTKYLVDTNNLTGYAQVVEEMVSGSVQRVYVYGHTRLSQQQVIGGNWQASFYGYDGHGSVRYLTDATGTITDSYTYDAFGVLIQRTGTTPNDYLYCGEQLDANLGFYYLRARYMNPESGRFFSMDSFEGFADDPVSLHKYLYTHANPLDNIDPTGHFVIGDFTLTQGLRQTVQSMSVPVATKALAAIATGLLVAGEIVAPLAALQEAADVSKDRSSGRYYFRGDDDYRGGPMGIFSLDSVDADNANIQEPWEHVLEKESNQTSRFTSFSEIYGNPTRGARFFGSKVYKVLIVDLRALELQGIVRIIDIETAVAMTSNHPKPKVRRKAQGVRASMEKHQEVLIEGQVPANLIHRAN